MSGQPDASGDAIPSWTHGYRRPGAPARILCLQSVFDETFAGVYEPYKATGLEQKAQEIHAALADALDERLYARLSALMQARLAGKEAA